MNRRAALMLIMVLTAGGCSTTSGVHDEIITRLNSRGAVVLSPDNPFLAANLLLARESEKSPELTGFLKRRGTPPAIEVRTSMFSPLTMDFYYPNNKQTYSLERSEETWLIRGPFPMSDELFREVAALTGHPAPTPPLPLPEFDHPPAQLALKKPESPTAPETPKIVNLRPPAAPAPAHSGFQSPPPEVNEEGAKVLTAAQEKEVIQRLIGAGEQHPAEITPKGDLVHYVTLPGETLTALARWYTLDRANGGRLARINDLKTSDEVTPGDTVVVPSYLVHNKNRLTEKALKELLKLGNPEAKH